MRKNILHFGIMVKTVMIGMLIGVAGKMNAYSYSFSAVCETGQRLYYNIIDTDNHYVEITCPNVPGNSAWGGYTKPIGNIIFPDSVQHGGITYTVSSIGHYAFYSCSGLTGNLTIPNSVTTIGDSAFKNCTGFTGGLTIGNSVITIDYAAFYGCSGLTGNLTISNSVTTIGYYAFYGCRGFTGSLTIGDSVTSIGGYAFSGCYGFTGSLTFGNSVTTIGVNAFQYCRGFTGNLTIPNTVTTIGNQAFYGCSGFTGSLTISDSVTMIGISVFYGCNGFTGSLTIPNSVTLIGYRAFAGCSGLTGSLTIPNSVTTIGDYAFQMCRGFTGSLAIHNSVTTIGEGAFSGCSGLDNIVVDSGNSVFDSRENSNSIIKTSLNELIAGCKNTVIPNSVVTIGNYAFYMCSDLSSIEIPNSVITIGDHAFQYCSGFTGNLTIPNSVTTIGNYAFYGSGFTGNLTIPNSVTTIQYAAFYDCVGLTEIVLLDNTPPILAFNNAFSNTNNSNNYPIYVPYESIDAYKTATNWSNYASRIYPMSYKSIPAYNESNDHYCFIASPLVDSIVPTTVDNLITETAYDLYQFSPSDTLGEWQNYKAHTNDFSLVNGQGYLYANEDEVNIIFKGEFNEDVTKEVNIVYDANDERKCFNLVGNPFPCNAYLNREYYILTTDGTDINPEPIPATTPIPPCTAVFVKAVAEGETVVFTRVAP